MIYLWYCHIIVGEIIQSVNYDNYDDFQHGNFIVFPPKKIVLLLWGLFNDKTDLKGGEKHSIHIMIE
jgi:hypothetical protein